MIKITNTKRGLACAKQGFTLMEIMLYMMIAAIILFVIISFSIQIIAVSKKSSDMQEIETNMDYIATKLSSTIQSASSIDNGDSVFENDIGTLTLNMPDLGKSPTVFFIEDEEVYLTEGSNPDTKISSDFIKCTQLRFEKVTTPKFPDQVIFDMQCEPINSDLANIQQQLSIHTTISLRR